MRISPENIGTISIVGLGVALSYIGIHASRYQQLGREALLCAASFLFSQAIIRTLSINDVIEPEIARSLVAISAIAALAVLAQIAWLRRLDNSIRRKHTCPPKERP